MNQIEALNTYLEKQVLILHKHERRFCIENPDKRDIKLHNIIQARFSPYNCCKGNGFWVCFTDRFQSTLSLYESEFLKSPDSFTGGIAIDIIKVLYNASNYCSSFEKYQEYLQTEACCYIIEEQSNIFGGILRLDLFRILTDEFIGGIFHSLKHFAINGHNLCNGPDKKSIEEIGALIRYIGLCFVKLNKEQLIKNDTISDTFEIDGSEFTIVLYREKESNVFFLKSFRAGTL